MHGEFGSKRDLRRATSTNLRSNKRIYEDSVEIRADGKEERDCCDTVDRFLSKFRLGHRGMYRFVESFFATDISFILVRSIRRNK